MDILVDDAIRNDFGIHNVYTRQLVSTQVWHKGTLCVIEHEAIKELYHHSS